MAHDHDHDHDLEKAHARIVARAWDDPAFKARLLADPAGVLHEEGFPIEPGQKVQVTEVDPNESHFILPRKPKDPVGTENLQHGGPPGFIVVTVCLFKKPAK